MKKKYFLFFAGFLLALNVVCWREVFILQEPKYLKVDFLAVGQGDAEFIETPQGHQILIDGGPNSSVLEKLNQRMPFWDKSIDVVILTHPEKDHMTGILDVLERYKISYFLWTGVAKDNAENKLLVELLNKAQNPNKSFLASINGESPTKVIAVNAGVKVKAGWAIIDIISPFEKVAGKEVKNVNNTSIVARLFYGKNSFLFPGDIDSATDKKLAVAELLKSDVLKVAHHGSKYSTSDLFLENVKPKIAVIEVGENFYGHPTPQTLQRLEKFGIQIKRTDLDGDIEVVSDGRTITLK